MPFGDAGPAEEGVSGFGVQGLGGLFRDQIVEAWISV